MKKTKKNLENKDENIITKGKTKKTKVCFKCKTRKYLRFFCKNKNLKDGYNNRCKSCQKQYRIENKDQINKYRNSKEIKEYHREYTKNYIKENRDKVKKYKKKYYQDNKEKIQKQKKEYYQNNREVLIEKGKEYNKEYKEKNKDIIRKKRKIYNKKNQDKIRIYKNEKYKTDYKYKIECVLRAQFYKKITQNLGKKYKSNSVIDLIGCTLDEYKQHIENQFLLEITWENHGKIWELDHIIACANFDLTKEEEQKKCFHYTNYQPLFVTTELAESLGYIDQIGNRNKYNK